MLNCGSRYTATPAVVQQYRRVQYRRVQTRSRSGLPAFILRQG